MLCLGLILDADGQKMSKSKGNVVVPWDVIDAHGADALRWYYFTSKQPWDGYRFSLEAVAESVRQFLKTLWNTYGFFVLYANVTDAQGEGEPTELDRWIRSRLAATIERVTERMEDYDTTFAGRAIAEFVDDLSNWYVRRSRRRFWDGDPAAFATLRESLLTVSKLLAPLTPVRRRRDLREPRRLGAVGAPLRLPGAGRARRGARVAHAGGARRGGAGARGARARRR